MKVIAFVPMKLANERLPGKNTKLLGGVEPLYRAIVRTLLSVSEIDDVYIFCSAAELEDLPGGVTYLQRSPKLDQPSTKINEVMAAFADAVHADIYVLAHATAPFLSVGSVEAMVRSVVDGSSDSALSVTSLREFLWQDGLPQNYDPQSIPRTQDIEPLFVETSGAYVYTRALSELGRRVGDRPALVEVSKIEAIDINDFSDWEIADAVYRAGLK